MKKTLKRLAKLAFFLAFFLFVIFTALTNLGGNSDILKNSIEDFVKENTPYQAHVGTLNNMNFFPDIILDVENVELIGEKADRPAFRFDKIKISMSFFDVLFKAQKYKMLYIENGYAAPGALFAESFVIYKAGILSENGEPAQLALSGKIGAEPLEARLSLESSGSASATTYFFGSEWPFEIALADAKASGLMKKDPDADWHVDDFKIEKAAQPILAGTLDLVRLGGGAFGVKGKLDLAPNGSVITPDLQANFTASGLKFKGKLEAPVLHIEDLSQNSVLGKLIGGLVTIPEKEATPEQLAQSAPKLSGLDFDLDAHIEKLFANKIEMGAVQSKFVLKDKILEVAPLSGAIMGGDLSGALKLDTSVSPLKFSLGIGVKNFDYAVFAEKSGFKGQAEGKADLVASLSAQAPTIDLLGPALSGNITFVGEKGRVNSGIPDSWAKGFASAVFPKMAADRPINMNCTVLDIGIQDNKARINSLLLQGPDLVMLGNGVYDIGADVMDTVLYPKPKGTGNVPAVTLTGPLADIEIKSGGYNAGGAGLTSGASDAAIPSISLAGITLKADHPCSEFVIQREILSAPVAAPENAAPAP